MSMESLVSCWVMLLEAGRTDTVGEVRLRVSHHVSFDALPKAGIVANSLAVGTYRQETAQGLDGGERLRKVGRRTAEFQLRNDLPGERL